ncbi:MAG: hypothetical protein QHC90_05115 [Shinella sp.]|nr:hypothetical protein [Shinella sp.]
MVVIYALRRFLLLFSVLGLLVAPASIGTAMGAMTASVSETEMVMDGDMPCCPEEQPVKKADCGKPCPLALICSTNLLGNFGATASWSVSLRLSNLSFPPSTENQHRSATLEPPARPPRA